MKRSIILCEKCGNEVGKDAKFCRTCGAKIEAKEKVEKQNNEVENKISETIKGKLDEKDKTIENEKIKKESENSLTKPLNKSKISGDRKNNKQLIIIICITIVLVLELLIGIFYYLKSNENEIVYGDGKNITITETNTINDAVDKVYNAVVYVESSRNSQSIGSGSGFIYKKDNSYGYIMTNYHVIENATSVSVTTMTGEDVSAEVVGGDSYSDVAVLKIAADKVPDIASIGDSTKLKVGDTVFTVGTPIDKEYMGTVTKGILSSSARTITVSSSGSGSYKMEVLQTDASINPGNSGGPLVNINGEVIGITSMKLVTTEIEGMGFAIPIEVAMSNVEKLENGESAERPYLGVSLYDLDTIMMYRYGIQTDGSVNEGTVVAEVEENSPAAEAGIKANDIITAIDGEKVSDSASLKYILYKHSIGDTITLKVYRNGADVELKVKLSKSSTN